MMYSIYTNGKTWAVALGGVVLRSGFASFDAADDWAYDEGAEDRALSSVTRSRVAEG